MTSDFLTVHPFTKRTSRFLRSQKNSQTSWSESPRGTLNVGRLLANKPCFVNPHPEQTEKKQSILFHDWSARGWDINRSIQARRLADELLQAGYPLYVFDAGELVKAESGKALVSLLKKNHEPCPEDELVLAAGKKKISRSMLHIIDYHQLNVLIDGSDPRGKVLETGDWWHNLNAQERKTLLPLLIKAKPSFDSINCRTFPDDITMAKELGEKLHISNMTWHFREVNLSPGDLDMLVRNGKLTRRNVDLEGKDFANIKSLTFHHCDEEELSLSEGFPHLQETFTSLKYLGLERAKNTACLRSMRLPSQCETLNLSNSDIDNETLETLLRNSPNLKHLGLESCKSLDWGALDYEVFAKMESLSIGPKVNFARLGGSAKQLKTLNLTIYSIRNTDSSIRLNSIETLSLAGLINAKELAVLLEGAEKLSSLELEMLTIEEGLNPTLSLPALKELRLSRSSITSQNLSALLHDAPRLKTLFLHDCKYISGAITCNGLHALEELDVSRSGINSQSLSALLHQAPRLKTLDLLGCRFISEEIACDSLYALEALDVSYSSINNQSLSALLYVAPRLKTLTLRHCSYISGKISSISRHALEALDASDSTITSESLSALIHDAPRLKILNLRNCRRLLEKITCNSLYALEMLDASDSTITSESLSALLRDALRLKTLNLSGCRNISGEIACNSLHALETLDATNSSINSQSLSALLRDASRLKTLKLFFCENISDEITCKGLPALEELIVGGSTITSESLSALLRNAPRLKTLKLYNCGNISGAVICKSRHALEALDVAASAINSQSLSALLRDTPRLKTLNLNFCKNISDTITCGRLHVLEELYVSGSSITSQSLINILKQAPSLKRLTLNNCPQFAKERLPLELQVLLQNTAVSHSEASDFFSVHSQHSPQNLPSSSSREPITPSRSDAHITPTENPVHNPEAHLASFVLTKSEPFRYRGINTSKNQGMVIEKLSQFLTLSQSKLHLIPRMKKGICNGLAHLFASMQTAEWGAFLNAIQAWNGQQETLTDTLRECFNRLLSAVENHQLILNDPQFFAGDALSAVLSTMRMNEHRILTTPWHAIAIRKTDENTWFFYDPNYIDGGQNITGLEKLVAEIHKSNGRLISILSHPEVSPVIDNPERFLAEGGLLSLCACANRHDMLQGLPDAHAFSGEALNGLLMRTTGGLPAWQMGQQHSDPRVRAFTQRLIERFQALHGSEANEILQGSVPESEPDTLPDSRLPAQKEQTINADTSAKNTTRSAQKIFYPLIPGVVEPGVSSYRLNVFDELRLGGKTCLIEQAFSLINNSVQEDFQPTDFRRLQKPPARRSTFGLMPAFLGIQELTLDASWQPLASLFPNEKLIEVHTEPVDADIHIAYSEEDNRYYIKSGTQTQTIRIHFVLQPAEPRHLPVLPPAIAALFEEIKTYGSGELENTGDNWSGKDYLDAIRRQKKGACRHRAVAFKAAMTEYDPGIPVRIITNDVHAFAEVCIEGCWLKMDLGGYPANLRIEEPRPPEAEPAASREVQETVIEAHLDANGHEVSDKPPVPQSSVYEAMLATWETNAPQESGLREYCQQKVRFDAPEKCLIELPSGEALTGLQHQLQTHCRHISRPVFYIHSPDDLICQAPFVRFKDSDSLAGESCKGPGGALYDFLQKSYETDNPPILIVNYSNFAADDIVRFNALLDNERFADGVAVPKAAKVIGLINTQKPDRYTGSDFYSRFGGNVETCPVDAGQLAAAIVTPFAEEADASADAVLINLYQAADWKERLLGRWTLQGNDLYFEEGSLTQALSSGKPITLENAPLDDPDFQHFWQQARVQGHINHARGELPFPETTSIALKQGYDWQALLQGASFDTVFAKDGIVCNPQKLPELFRRYECRDESLYTLPGLLEEHADKVLHLNVTRALSEDAWAECLSAAQKHQVRLHLHFTSASMMPTFLPSAVAASSSSSSSSSRQTEDAAFRPWQHDAKRATAVVISTDPDATIADVTQKEPGQWRVVDISECHPGDLLASLKGRFDNDSGRFVFSEKISALTMALDAGHSVLLTGAFSPELADELAEVIYTRRGQSTTGRLMLVASHPETFAFTEQSAHEVTAAEKQALLELQDEELSAIGGAEALQTLSFAPLKARRDFIRVHPGQNPEKAWEGMETLPGKVELAPFNAENSLDEARRFHTGRLDAVEGVLSSSPFVFLTGLTGVGKTTIVREHLAKKHSVHLGEEALQDWITDKSDALKVLFIDEANLELRQWSQFEGLFHQPPTLLVNGELVTLTDTHRVVFAGNPVSYGDDRSLASLFARHGKALIFDPLPLACIYEDILKPVFPGDMPEAEILTLCQPILDVYQYVCERSTDEVLITPRELQMMALLLTHAPQSPSIERARELAYTIAGLTLPPEHKQAFEQRFPKEPAIGEYAMLAGNFILTPSRQPLAERMGNLLALRHARLTKDGLNDAQKYGGLGGIIFEGEPGVGKSDFVKNFLRTRDYQRADVTADVFPVGNFYYEIPVSMGLEEKTRALMKAFHAGAVVIIDEINSSPMMEKLLNGLLMGTGPNGERPDNPGFMVIGTQNPVTMAGRQAQSSALARRMLTLAVPEYPKEELQRILQAATGINHCDAKDLEEAFTKQSAFAKKHHLKPAPCFRDLLNLAQNRARTLNLTPENNPWHAPAASSVPPDEDVSLTVGADEASPDGELLHQSPEREPVRNSIVEDHVAEAARELVQRHYRPSAWNEWRQGSNWLGVSADDLREEPYTSGCKGLRDVALKRKILEILAEALLRAETPEQYQEALSKLDSSGAVSILTTGMGFSSRIFQLQTSSSDALTAIEEEVWEKKPWAASRSPGNG
ncbi:AAA family ATPase [Legionella geestiana]|nr:AAA family ATPase [Legionella geestiana]